ncbi:MAG: hypothetical protein NZ602_14715 [Thermoguttaceae bacterium]|nr:hypothetical protein [Thermoguttaceae bacterium]MDW8038396.1 hypothetical protein [Thermoguttaceae bacterium]
MYVAFPPRPAVVGKLLCTFRDDGGKLVFQGLTNSRGQLRTGRRLWKEGKTYRIEITPLYIPKDEKTLARISLGPELTQLAQQLGFAGVPWGGEEPLRMAFAAASPQQIEILRDFHSPDGKTRGRLYLDQGRLWLDVVITEPAQDCLAGYRILSAWAELLEQGFVILSWKGKDAAQKDILSGRICLQPQTWRRWTEDCYVEVYPQPLDTLTPTDLEILRTSGDRNDHPDVPQWLRQIVSRVQQSQRREERKNPNAT